MRQSPRFAEVRDRLYLIRENAHAVDLAVRGHEDLDALVVAVIDTRDPIGRELIGDTNRLQAERIAGPTMIPVAIAVIPLGLAKELFGETHPRIAAGLRLPPPPGCVRVVCIASGGVTMVFHEVGEVQRAVEA